MKITIYAVGKLGASFLKEGTAEFLKRLQPYAQVSIVEIKDEKLGDKPSQADRERAITLEGERILKQLKPQQYMFLLDVHGTLMASETLATTLEKLGVDGQSDLAFVIGGTFGVSEGLRKRAQIRLSFSPMTFTHQMMRFLLVEQLYRAFKINKHEPYHW